ncbi:hypothetical protein J4X10_17300, partial [Escherichia coli]
MGNPCKSQKWNQCSAVPNTHLKKKSNDLPYAIAKRKHYCALVQKNAYAEQIGKYFGDKTEKEFDVDANVIVA